MISHFALMIAPARVKTIKELASEIGVTRRTISNWRKLEGCPERHKDGWDVAEWQEWLRGKGLGPYGTQPDPEDSGKASLYEQNVRLRREQADNERIKKERQLVDQQRELGEIMLVADFRDYCGKSRGVVMTVMDSHSDAVDRELPEKCPTEDAWPEIRRRVMELSRQLSSQVANAMETEW